MTAGPKEPGQVAFYAFQSAEWAHVEKEFPKWWASLNESTRAAWAAVEQAVREQCRVAVNNAACGACRAQGEWDHVFKEPSNG